MNILFIHQNFPGQFKHLSVALASQGHSVTALTLRVKERTSWKGVDLIPYGILKRSEQSTHPWVLDLDSKVTRGESCYRAARKMKEAGYTPDIIIAHHGWGESMFLRDVWPSARMGLYCEFYHLTDYPHINFDPEFPSRDEESEGLRIRLKNINNHLHFDVAQMGLSPTRFQADTFPQPFRDKIDVIHDGINTRQLVRNDDVAFPLPNGQVLTREDEVITFVNRNLEPYRGYHIFMRALPRLLKERPGAQVLVVGGDGVSYGAHPPKGKTWKQIYIDEVRGRISDEDWARVHFLGRIPYTQFVPLLQLSRAHLYLTYPFVLSWSLFEAMACEAAIVASSTAPVVDALRHDLNARLVDFFDPDALVEETVRLLEDADMRDRLGITARDCIVRNYDLTSACLPRQLEWVERLASAPL
ncbi:glycosyltransferase [Pseudooceanicola onchidii]|uniref:glycosyltransferase n=1 Tax=Pseudooceanicola onchidii TaxID=2562279 RepID=UPI0010AB33B2|nr:glycosyltransferase [Pseudooceanicola onchidii]